MRSELLKHQVGGDHYKKGVQPWEAIVKFNLTFLRVTRLNISSGVKATVNRI
jgi:hypothetical protein